MRKTRAALGNTTVAVIAAVALIIGVGIGYFGSTNSGNVTKTIDYTYTTVSTYTTTAALSQGTEVLQCIVTHYIVYSLEYGGSSTTSFGKSTWTSPVQTYQTLTAGIQSVGYAITWTVVPTTTQTRTRNWNSTVCTVIWG